MTVHHQQRQPVVGGTFGERHRQHHHADQHQLEVAVEGQPFFGRVLFVSGVLTGAVRDGPDAGQDRNDAHQRRQQDMQIRAHAGSRQCHPHARTGQRAEAVKTVHHWQHGFIHLTFDRRPFHVDGNFRRTEAAAKYRQAQGEQHRRGKPQRHA